MKKIALLLGILVAANILFAQEPGPRAQVKIEKYKERLNLSESQVSELKQLRQTNKPQLEAIRNDDSKSRSEKMAAKSEVIRQQEIAVAQILNDEQEAELKVIQQELRERAKRRRHRRRNGDQ